MDNNLFDDLVASIKEAGAIKRKEVKASRVTELELPDIKEVREKTGLSQNEFAARLHISPRTLQNWEQGRRYPTGPAATLIRILDAHPSLICRLKKYNMYKLCWIYISYVRRKPCRSRVFL